MSLFVCVLSLLDFFCLVFFFRWCSSDCFGVACIFAAVLCLAAGGGVYPRAPHYVVATSESIAGVYLFGILVSLLLFDLAYLCFRVLRRILIFLSTVSYWMWFRCWGFPLTCFITTLSPFTNVTMIKLLFCVASWVVSALDFHAVDPGSMPGLNTWLVRIPVYSEVLFTERVILMMYYKILDSLKWKE